MTMHKDFQELLSAFNAHNVAYLLVGGYAVGVHSEPRATKDLDVWIKPDPQNSLAVFHALEHFPCGCSAGRILSCAFSPMKTLLHALFGIPGNRENALAAFGAPLAGFSPSDFNDPPRSVFQMGIPPYRIDILQQIDGVDFDEAWESRIDTAIDAIPVHVISSAMLIKNKLTVGRPRDLLDVEEIREAALEAPADNPQS